MMWDWRVPEVTCPQMGSCSAEGYRHLVESDAVLRTGCGVDLFCFWYQGLNLGPCAFEIGTGTTESLS